MQTDQALTFSLIEWLSVTGLVQSVWVLVYVLLRVRQWRQAALSIAYFFFLALAFALQFALRLEDYAHDIRMALWAARAMLPPLAYLLVLQVVRLVDLPPARHFLVLLALPLTVALSYVLIVTGDVSCASDLTACAPAVDIFQWCGAVAGGLCLLPLWLHRGIFTELWHSKPGRERYWLVMTLLTTTIFSLCVSFMLSGKYLSTGQADALQTVFGMAFAYLATTTLFRVYPAPVQLNASPRGQRAALSEDETLLGEKIRQLMTLEKVYHEQAFSRADLARELGASESTVSKVINSVFACSFPKLLNDYRVEDAKRMLQDPEIAIQVVAFEVGFNSLASFNRVFREIAGETPSSFRARFLKAQG
jgi:AraC-like DNA-binding protein